MNNKFKYRILSGVVLLGTLFFGVACNDWDDHYDVTAEGGSETLYSVIKRDAQLKNFLTVLDSCTLKKFSHMGKEREPFNFPDSLLNKVHTYTVWAPVISDEVKDSLLNEISTGNRDEVVKRFVFGHMTNYLQAANGNLKDDNSILLLNNKKAVFTGNVTDGYTFDGIKITDSNISVSNGLLHKIGNKVYYAPSIWEYIRQESSLDSVASFFDSFSIYEFNEYLSPEGPIVNGELTYLDSIFDFRNVYFDGRYGSKLTAGIGDITAEDSTYTMYVPKNDVWSSTLKQIEPHFKYYHKKDETSTRKEYLDSLEWVLPRRSICKYLLFSKNEQNGMLKDTIQAMFLYPRRKFSQKKLDEAVEDSVRVSNGVVKIMKSYPFSPYDIWFDTIKIEAENTAYLKSYSPVPTPKYYDELTQEKDSVVGKLSGNGYIAVLNAESNNNVSLTYRIPDVLSGKYKLCFAVVPPHIGNPYMLPDSSAVKSTRIRVNVKYNYDSKDVNDDYYVYEMKRQTLGKNLESYINDKTRIDTLFLYDKELNSENENDPEKRVPAILKFDRCELGYDEDETGLEIEFVFDTSLRSDSDREKYTRNLGIDYIMLIPVIDDEEDAADDVPAEE